FVIDSTILLMHGFLKNKPANHPRRSTTLLIEVLISGLGYTYKILFNNNLQIITIIKERL
ncbi:MAG: hypothetical protein L7T26_00595, partial [Pseudomonadales bacterium]|nr:hypothetical protein [Pseudomonadales bacterium]